MVLVKPLGHDKKAGVSFYHPYQGLLETVLHMLLN